MLLMSIGILLIVGMLAGKLVERFHLPALIGYLTVGILLGPYVGHVLDDSLIQVAPTLQRFALVIILSRAGLTMDVGDLRAIGRPAILMCFIPAVFEIFGAALFGHLLLGFNLAQSLLVGAILAAVSPAVLVPRMVDLIKERIGTNKKIPQLLLAGASADDVVVYALFAIFLNLNMGSELSWMTLVDIPVTLLTGLVAGIIVGFALVLIYRRFTMSHYQYILMTLSVGFILMGVEDALRGQLAFSGVLAIIAANMIVLFFEPKTADLIEISLSQTWGIAQILLFALLGARVNPQVVAEAGFAPLLFIILTGIIRMIGVRLSIIKAGFNTKERWFIMLSYIPKATEQAAIGGVPLALGIVGGEMMLIVATTSIFVTATLGAILVDQLAPRWLEQEERREIYIA